MLRVSAASRRYATIFAPGEIVTIPFDNRALNRLVALMKIVRLF
jgi:hypothetical protein